MAGKVFIVGLAGASGSGKSSVARRVAAGLGGHVLSLETYAAEFIHLPLEERAKRDYDAPEATDVKLLESHIRGYRAGQTIEAPVYDFGEHLRVKGKSVQVPAGGLLLVEGILALHYAELRPYFDLAIYLEAPEEVCFHRRKVRDITERQRPLEFIRWQYETMVMPAARKYLLPSKSYAQVVVDSGRDLASVEKSVVEAIEKKRGAAKS